jgi:predicted GNAT family acetyltransferase
MTDIDIEVANAPERLRYEARVGGSVVGFAEYILATDLIVFTHTEVDPGFEGKGVGAAIARFALDDVRDTSQRKVMPLCPFIKGWIGRHPEYISLVKRVPASTARD